MTSVSAARRDDVQPPSGIKVRRHDKTGGLGPSQAWEPRTEYACGLRCGTVSHDARQNTTGIVDARAQRPPLMGIGYSDRTTRGQQGRDLPDTLSRSARITR